MWESKMSNRKNKLKLSKNIIFISVVFALIFNITMFYILSKAQSDELDYGFYLMMIVINLILFGLVKIVFGKKGKDKKLSLRGVASLFDGIDYLKPDSVVLLDTQVVNDFVDIEEEDSFVLEDNEVLILKPKTVIKAKAQFDSRITFDKYIDQMHTYFMDNGLEVNKDSLRTTLSMISASRMIYIKHKSMNLAHRFIELFSSFLGSTNHILEAQDGVLFHKDLMNLMDAAKTRKHILNFIVLSKLDFTKFEATYDHLIQYAYHSYKFGEHKLPNNIWFFMVAPKGNPTNMLYDTLFTLDLNALVIEPKEVVHENDNKLSFERLMHTLRDIEENHYIDELSWKKIDQFEAYVNDHLPFKLDNKIIRQLEIFSTMYTVSGGEQLDCLDTMLSSKLLNIVLSLNITRQDIEDEGFIEVFDRVFGLENLMTSKELVKTIEDQFILNKEVVS